ncbi:hypothetical protein [Dyella sp. ASV21]|uniref:hypothetical protein n=1 Tax=Dyella sp. ASV21 TaxID=2795114 RepID=UPI0018EA7264|nr:hypothetical protein [Dyella sp. ASV21]
MSLLHAPSRNPQQEQAIAVIEQWLGLQAAYGLLNESPQTLAERTISHAWAQKHALLEGQPGAHPHKLAVAAFALALGAKQATEHADGAMRGNYLLALGHILDEAARADAHHGFHDTDRTLLDLAAATFTSCPHGLKDATSLD